MNETKTSHIAFSPINNKRLASLCGPFNQNLQQLEEIFKVQIHQRSNMFEIHGSLKTVKIVKRLLSQLYQETEQPQPLNEAQFRRFIQQALAGETETEVNHQPLPEPTGGQPIITPRGIIHPRSAHQQGYVDQIRHMDMNFAVGPAGTGKTFLAVACAVEALEKGSVQRLIFVRPAVEAGENLGFLPGDLEQKILPYLRPLYDALQEMVGYERVKKLVEHNVIEIAPLAFMRGRTLNNAFIILDEAQNTTTEQMKMFLTRIGFGSTVVITGDVTQIDLGRNVASGLVQALKILKDVSKISFNYFDSKDAVRHPLVQTIIDAYDSFDQPNKT